MSLLTADPAAFPVAPPGDLSDAAAIAAHDWAAFSALDEMTDHWSRPEMAAVTTTYLAASTFGMIGAGRKELAPRLVVDFAALLGIDARELAAFIGVVLPELPQPPAPEAVDAASRLREARRLSVDQAQHVSELARSMRRNSGNAYVTNLPGSRW